jgi:hypothetical protein
MRTPRFYIVLVRLDCQNSQAQSKQVSRHRHQDHGVSAGPCLIVGPKVITVWISCLVMLGELEAWLYEWFSKGQFSLVCKIHCLYQPNVRKGVFHFHKPPLSILDWLNFGRNSCITALQLYRFHTCRSIWLPQEDCVLEQGSKDESTVISSSVFSQKLLCFNLNSGAHFNWQVNCNLRTFACLLAPSFGWVLFHTFLFRFPFKTKILSAGVSIVLVVIH